jgi:hypothetical protein
VVSKEDISSSQPFQISLSDKKAIKREKFRDVVAGNFSNGIVGVGFIIFIRKVVDVRVQTR